MRKTLHFSFQQVIFGSPSLSFIQTDIKPRQTLQHGQQHDHHFLLKFHEFPQQLQLS